MLKKSLIVSLAVLSALFTFADIQAKDAADTTPQAQKKDEIQDADIKRLSEAFGNYLGKNLNAPGIKFDLDSIIKGMREGADGKSSPMSDQEYDELLNRVQEKAHRVLSEENLKAAQEFIAKNAKEKGVIEIEPGKLQYTVIKEGTGPAVQPHASPQIAYTGKFIDGTVFGSSEEVGGPITIPLDQTIPGFTKGLLGMKEGEKRRIFVHPDLGYGTMGQLPPNSLLIFEVEIVKANTAGDQAKNEDDLLLPLALEDDRD